MKPYKIRAWNGEEWVSPDYITREGVAYWKENSIPTCTTVVREFTGFTDKFNKEIWEGSKVKFYYTPPNEKSDPKIKGEFVECEVVWNTEKGMWSLKWPDGQINSAPLNPKKYEVVA